MSNDNIRKNDSLGTSAAQLQVDFKQSHSKYNDLVSELALLTKSELRQLFNSLKGKTNINGLQDEINVIFDKIENVLFDMEDSHLDMDEIVQTVGGLEFSTSNTVDKLTEIMRYQENQQARMTKEITQIKEEFENGISSGNFPVTELIEDIEDFQLEFSRFQDYVQDSVPRVNQLFDDLDKEEEIGLKFGKTNKI